MFVERVALSDPKHIRAARAAIRKALQVQKEGKGYTFVEVLSPCPTNLGKTSVLNNEWINEEMAKEFPIQNFRDRTEEAQPIERAKSDFTDEALAKAFDLASLPATQENDDPNFGEAQVKISEIGRAHV